MDGVNEDEERKNGSDDRKKGRREEMQTQKEELKSAARKKEEEKEVERKQEKIKRNNECGGELAKAKTEKGRNPLPGSFLVKKDHVVGLHKGLKSAPHVVGTRVAPPRRPAVEIAYNKQNMTTSHVGAGKNN
jgi:hypothetical protein